MPGRVSPLLTPGRGATEKASVWCGSSKAARVRRHALLAFTAWLGHVQLVHAAPGVRPGGEEARVYLAFMLGTVMGAEGFLDGRLTKVSEGTRG